MFRLRVKRFAGKSLAQRAAKDAIHLSRGKFK
jgi:hypothetical protein